jgi:hypothetical protein
MIAATTSAFFAGFVPWFAGAIVAVISLRRVVTR